MARKSRKHIENSAVPTCSLNLRTAAYLRISEVKPGLPPESIENQLKIIEKYFPLRRIRLISVTDQVETADGISNLDKQNPINILLLNLCNEAVSNEISRSTQTVLNIFATDGKYIAPRAPYGYRKSLDNCHKLLIAPESAAIVRKSLLWHRREPP